jgi:hypothetical protein
VFRQYLHHVLVDIFHLGRLLESRWNSVSCARAKAEGGRPLCVGASYRGNACLCFYHCDVAKVDDLCMSARHIGVTHVCVFTTVASLDYARSTMLAPSVNLYNFNMTRIDVASGESW